MVAKSENARLLEWVLPFLTMQKLGKNVLSAPIHSFHLAEKIPPRSLVVGSPRKVVRELNDKDFDIIQLSIDSYVQKGYDYREIFTDEENE